MKGLAYLLSHQANNMTADYTPKKSLGQHWLNDASSLAAMTKAAELSKEDIVLEIGPGLGSLTRLLVDQAKQVTAIELDNNLASRLGQSINSPKLNVINGDILKLNLNEIDKGYKLIANIPYYLTSKLIRVISESSNPPDVAVLLVQKEVAERLAAHPGKMSILAVTAQFYWEISLSLVVPAALFTPPPKVDSQIVVLERRAKPLYGDIAPSAYFRVVKSGFASKRKTISNSLSASLRLDVPTIQAHLSQAGIDPIRRAQTLTLEEWHQLALAIT
jgi:16S rRNA (adenine1518-N6/adenine1519-N6)-dimethyltransferase